MLLTVYQQEVLRKVIAQHEDDKLAASKIKSRNDSIVQADSLGAQNFGLVVEPTEA